ncbi:endothelial differentiation-related factor 1 homolog [Corticium candelabrum]|uniref:endothelial differentiation-related factor 1 homolog n=1 Tax=Corticium candelabrum TaxID=121492 RepID=UPI002E271896|nr:endothelial differentiation-related factor 1 homolog [Corticium candelabrum]
MCDGAATNIKQVTSTNTAKLDRETEELHQCGVNGYVGRIIEQVRKETQMTPKKLATCVLQKIDENPQVVDDCEEGRAIPNNQIMGKLERIFGVKSRGKDKGQLYVADWKREK